MSGKLAHPTRWRHRHYRKGLLIWASGLGELAHEGIYRATDEEIDVINAQKWNLNNVTDEGEDWILYAAFHDNPEPNGGTFTGFELGLSTSGALAETTTYSGASELGDGDGYSAKSVERGATTGWTDPTGTTPSSITTPRTGTHTWNATGTWTAVEAAILMTVGQTTNTLIAYDNLSTTRSLVNGDQLDVDFDIQAGGS